MKPSILFLGILFFGVFPEGCKKSDPTPVSPPVNPCLNVNIVPVASKTHTVTGQLLGTITVTSP